MIPAPRFTSDDVHLWFLPEDDADLEKLRLEGLPLLSVVEKKRLDKMTTPAPADRFLLGRILMRRVLAFYLNFDPSCLEIAINDNGKPELIASSLADLSFSLTHSNGETILAVTKASAIGVDLETMSRAEAAERIAQRFFSAPERRYLAALDENRATQSMILWSLKESIVKASGDTVWDGLTNVSLKVDGNKVAWLSAPEQERYMWKLVAGIYRETFSLAVAVKSPRTAISLPLALKFYRLGGMTQEVSRFSQSLGTLALQ